LGVDDRSNAKRGDIGNDDFEPRRPDPLADQGGSKSGPVDATPLSARAAEFAGLEQLADDVAAADELALDVELGNGRPVRIGLDAVAQIADSRTFKPL